MWPKTSWCFFGVGCQRVSRLCESSAIRNPAARVCCDGEAGRIFPASHSFLLVLFYVTSIAHYWMILPLIMWEFANFTVSPMDSEWSKPYVYGALHIDTRLFCVACNNRQCPPKHACDEISMTPSPGISRLRDVLQLVVYASHGSPFPESRACRGHPSRPLHVASRFGDKLYATHGQALGNVLAEMPFACD